MKLNQKRIKNNEFEQVEKCLNCGKLFWARQWYDDWKQKCNTCNKIEKLEGKKLFEEAKKNGKQVKTFSGEIFGWEYNNDFFENPKYSIDYTKTCKIGNKIITVNNIDDYIRDKKKEKITEIVWPKECFDLLRNFCLANGYFVNIGDKYMGVRHFVQ